MWIDRHRFSRPDSGHAGKQHHQTDQPPLLTNAHDEAAEHAHDGGIR
jgi:hypothetical protein